MVYFWFLVYGISFGLQYLIKQFYLNSQQLVRLWQLVELVQPEDMVKTESLLLASATMQIISEVQFSSQFGDDQPLQNHRNCCLC